MFVFFTPSCHKIQKMFESHQQVRKIRGQTGGRKIPGAETCSCLVFTFNTTLQHHHVFNTAKYISLFKFISVMLFSKVLVRKA